MKRILSLRLLLSLTFLVGTLSFALLALSGNPAQAARPSEPHQVYKLRINDFQWDDTAQRFELDLSCQQGIAQAGARAFQVGTELRISIEGNPETIILQAQNAVSKEEGALSDSERMVQLKPQYIPWDRINYTYEGPVNVWVEVMLKNRNGHIIGNPVTEYYLQLSVN